MTGAPAPATRPRVALLGGTGFAGRNVREVLEQAGVEVSVFSRTNGADLLDLPEVCTKLDAFAPDYLVNCAAIVGSINYVSDFAADVIDVNMRMVLNLYKVAQQFRRAVVVNPVANCAYPGALALYREDDLWSGPLDPSVLSYGSTRRMMLALSDCYARQYGVRSVNLLVPNMYGPFDSTNPTKTHALNALIIKFVRARKQAAPAIEVWGTGRPVREWLFVRDFAKVVLRVVLSGNPSSEPVNIGQSFGHSILEIVEILRGLTDYRGEIVFNRAYGDGAPRKVMDDARFRTRFPGFSFTPFDDGLRETIAYYESIL